MKAKLERYLRWLREGFLQMLRLHPVESALTVYACAGCLLTYELDWDHSLPKLALAALFFAVALVVNNLAGRGPWRRVYWVSWTPIVPLSLWGGLEAWIVSEPAFLTFGILVPLALLMCRRAVRIAESLGRLGDDGRLILTPVPPADSVYREAYHGLYESLKFVERRDTAVFARFGTDLDGFAAIFPERMRSYVRWGYDYCNSYCVNNIIELEAPVNARFEVNAEYPHYYMNLRGWSDSSYHFGGDTLRLFLGEERAVHRIPCQELLERQLKESGFEPSEGCEPTSDQLLRLLDYRDDRCRILFENIKLERTDSAVVIQGLSINAVLMR